MIKVQYRFIYETMPATRWKDCEPDFSSKSEAQAFIASLSSSRAGAVEYRLKPRSRSHRRSQALSQATG